LSLGLSARDFTRQFGGGERIDAADNPVLRQAADQLGAYFAGTLRRFDLPLDLRGTSFQKRVWSELLRIPFGETRSYGELARVVGNPNASRAVGAANGRNPVAIVVPCHRVIGSDGGLVGFGGGLHYKRRLLDLEREAVTPSLFSRTCAAAG
jgi:methylated-DNA-[protein]-cysteine S-methyltransferase